MSKRRQIVDALVTQFKTIDGTGDFSSNLFTNVFNKLKFWDEVNDYPSVFVNAGQESREYLPGEFKWGHLAITIRVYVKAEEPETELENIFEDIERIIDANGNLEYDAISGSKTEDIKIISINTDEGLLAPIGVGDITLHIMYDL
jgi:hypothetical protein